MVDRGTGLDLTLGVGIGLAFVVQWVSAWCDGTPTCRCDNSRLYLAAVIIPYKVAVIILCDNFPMSLKRNMCFPSRSFAKEVKEGSRDRTFTWLWLPWNDVCVPVDEFQVPRKHMLLWHEAAFSDSDPMLFTELLKCPFWWKAYKVLSSACVGHPLERYFFFYNAVLYFSTLFKTVCFPYN